MTAVAPVSSITRARSVRSPAVEKVTLRLTASLPVLVASYAPSPSRSSSISATEPSASTPLAVTSNGTPTRGTADPSVSRGKGLTLKPCMDIVRVSVAVRP